MTFTCKKSIIIYFSRADENYVVGYIEKGNTEVITEYIKDKTGTIIFKVEPKNSYSKDYEVINIGFSVYWPDLLEELVTTLNGIDFT